MLAIMESTKEHFFLHLLILEKMLPFKKNQLNYRIKDDKDKGNNYLGEAHVI